MREDRRNDLSLLTDSNADLVVQAGETGFRLGWRRIRIGEGVPAASPGSVSMTLCPDERASALTLSRRRDRLLRLAPAPSR